MADKKIDLSIEESALVNEFLSKCDGLLIGYKTGIEQAKSLFLEFLIKSRKKQPE